MRARNILKYPVHYAADRPAYNITADRKREGTVGTLEDVTGDIRTQTEYKNGKWEIATGEVEFHSSIRYNRDVPREGLVAEYLFHEGAGNILHDTSGFNNHGTIHGMIWERLFSGKIVGRLDGVDDYVRVPGSSSLNTTKAFTIRAWIFDTGDGTKNHSINKDGATRIWMIRRDTDTKLKLIIWNSEGVSGMFVPEGTWAIKQWFRIVCTARVIADNIEMKAFFNGVLKKTIRFAGTAIAVDTSIPILIGRHSVNYKAQLICGVEFYNLAQSATEIRNDFERSRALYGV